MSIRSDAYQLCKKVWTSPSREKIQEIIWSLNRATDEQIKTGQHRANFGMAARQLRAQLLAYLIVDRDKQAIAENYPPLNWCDGLTTDERLLLAGAYRDFDNLNSACIANFINTHPFFLLALNPYEQFGYEIPDDALDTFLLQPEDIELMAESFQRHRAFTIANESFLKIQEQLQEHADDFYAKAVFSLENKLLDSGPLSTPRQLSDIFFRSAPDSVQRITHRFIAALLSIKSSLTTLDELVFQAILTNKLPVLNENNIIEFGSLVGHASGNGLTILAQSGESLSPIDIGLVLVKDRTIDIPLDLFFVEAINFQSSQDLGDTLDLHLRDVNENLNRFSRLLDNI